MQKYIHMFAWLQMFDDNQVLDILICKASDMDADKCLLQLYYL